jgi:hypothetical protein
MASMRRQIRAAAIVSAVGALIAGEVRGDDRVAVQVVSDDDSVILERRAPSGKWYRVCGAFCRETLSTAFEYRAAGAGIVPSSSFDLPMNGERITVYAARKYNHTAGGLLLTAGIIGVVVGGVVSLLALKAPEGEGPNAAAGLVVLGFGGAAMVGGVFLLSMRTAVVF